MIQKRKSTFDLLKRNTFYVLEWPSQSPDLNPIKMLGQDQKQAVHAQKPTSLSELVSLIFLHSDVKD
uniref:Tc1-like transposase DDE domain-containing protein n=1 Tax=Anguilla anguilla TaxID=7936 RepID=A0A0E9R872_ANGAN